MRLLNRIYAKLHGNFWLPCPVCGCYFGGHERGGGQVLRAPTSATVTCPDCPGDWAVFEGRMCKLEPRLDEDGSFRVTFCFRSSDWKRQPLLREPEIA